MDYDYSQHEREFEQGNVLAFNVEEEDDYYEDYEENNQQQQQEQRREQFQQPQTQTQQQQQQLGRRDKRQDEEIGAASSGGKANNQSSSAAPGKLFVGGLSWDTTEDTFSNYFSKFGEITDAVIMLDRHSGRPRGFGFVTFADTVVADRVLKQEHIIDDRTVEVKKTVPREDMDFKGLRVKKIFVGGLAPSLTEDDLKEYFVFYGGVTEYQIMYDHTTGRSRGFGFVTFESEDSVERLFADHRTHELGGKEVEIKKAEPRRFGGGGGDYGGATKPYGGGFNDTNGYGGGRGSGGRYSGKMGRGGGGGGGYGGYGSYPGFNGYGAYGAGYAGGAAGLYGAYGGYGYGFGFNNLMMYGNGMYGGGGGGAGFPGGGYGPAAGYSKGYGRSGEGSGDNGGRGYGNGGGKSYGGSSSSSGGGNVAGRHHPYRK